VTPASGQVPRLLLVEPDSLVRRTVASVARSLSIADIREAGTYDTADLLLHSDAFDGLIIALTDDGRGIDLVEQLRAGEMESARDCPVVVMTGRCDESRVTALRALSVRRVILKPFKVKTVLESVAQLTNGQAT
jgi:DNA-binding NarL/FixJ family response regulator